MRLIILIMALTAPLASAWCAGGSPCPSNGCACPENSFAVCRLRECRGFRPFVYLCVISNLLTKAYSALGPMIWASHPAIAYLVAMDVLRIVVDEGMLIHLLGVTRNSVHEVLISPVILLSVATVYEKHYQLNSSSSKPCCKMQRMKRSWVYVRPISSFTPAADISTSSNDKCSSTGDVVQIPSSTL
jgi:hypothetical protein